MKIAKPFKTFSNVPGHKVLNGFRRGMDLYFARHDGQAVTCEEFVGAMFDANQQKNADKFMR